MTLPGLAATASDSDPTVALAILSALGLAIAVLVGLALRIVLKDRRALRCCPLCGADAIADAEVERLDAIEVRATLRCGQCGTWRRLRTTGADHDAHECRLERHRQDMRECLGRLEADRRAYEVGAFITLLRSDIAGAGDFLSSTRARGQVRRRRRDPRRGES